MRAEREEVDLISIGARSTRSTMHPLFGSNVDHVQFEEHDLDKPA